MIDTTHDETLGSVARGLEKLSEAGKALCVFLVPCHDTGDALIELEERYNLMANMEISEKPGQETTIPLYENPDLTAYPNEGIALAKFHTPKTKLDSAIRYFWCVGTAIEDFCGLVITDEETFAVYASREMFDPQRPLQTYHISPFDLNDLSPQLHGLVQKIVVSLESEF